MPNSCWLLGRHSLKAIPIEAVYFLMKQTLHEVFTFTNCGATGRIGPTEAQIQAEYNGTNLQVTVTTGWKAGYQKWTVPATGDLLDRSCGC